jgi:hypothetical protein
VYGPPPGYGAPPYGWPVQPQPSAPPKPKYPSDAAAQTSPFIDVMTGGMVLEDRFNHFLLIGLQGGAYLGGRFRIVAHALMFTSDPKDDFNGGSSYYYDSTFPAGYSHVPSDSPTIIFGGAIGVAPVVRRNFVFAPGISYHRSNVSDYGSMLAVTFPLEWVTDDGARFGFVVDIGRAFGGEARGDCTAGATTCSSGGQTSVSRTSGTGFFSAFQFGWGFNHPKPNAPEPTE